MVVIARNIVPMATPAKANFTGDIAPPDEELIIKITVTANPAPMNELTITPAPEIAGNKAIITINPKAAPSVTPMIDGDASGLRVIPCIIVPDTAKQAPTKAADNTRGNRNS